MPRGRESEQWSSTKTGRWDPWMNSDHGKVLVNRHLSNQRMLTDQSFLQFCKEAKAPTVDDEMQDVSLVHPMHWSPAHPGAELRLRQCQTHVSGELGLGNQVRSQLLRTALTCQASTMKEGQTVYYGPADRAVRSSSYLLLFTSDRFAYLQTWEQVYETYTDQSNRHNASQLGPAQRHVPSKKERVQMDAVSPCRYGTV